MKINKKILLLLIVLLLLGVLGAYILNQTSSQTSTIDVDPIFVGPAACSGQVIDLKVAGDIVSPVTFHGDKIWLVNNGVSYTVDWKANADVLGLAPVQTGTSTFTAGTDGMVNHPAISVSYTVQDVW